jgi:hypothetical protein
VKFTLADNGPVVPLRAAIALLFLTACISMGTTRTVVHQETVPNADAFPTDVSSSQGAAGVAAIDPLPGTVVVEPTTERVVSYVAIIGGVIACTILIIGFYRLAKLLGH